MSLSKKFVEITDVGMTFETAKGNFTALRNIDLTIEQGEFITLIGHSGCGKSTLLNLIAGLTLPSTGHLICAGREIAGPGPERGVVAELVQAELFLRDDRLADADRVLRAMLTKFGSQPHLYVMLARVREKSGERIAAMRVLETCLEKCACGTGGCNKPADGPTPGQVVDRTITQRRQRDADRVDTMQEVVAERARLHHAREIARARRDHAYVHLHLLRPADAIEAARLQRTQELRLQLEVQLPHIVEIERPPGGEFD